MTSKFENYKKAYYNQAGALSSYEAQADGSLLIHGVVIMAAGAWTDMHGIDTEFSPEVLQRCALQWVDNAVWTRHSGGAPRPITEKVGAVINQHYSPELNAVVGDVLLHGQTEASRASINLVQLAKESGGITDVSAETIVDLSTQGQVLDVVFTGLALVEDGACEVCRLPAFSKEEIDMADDTEIKTTEEVKTEAEDAPVQTHEDLVEMLGAFVGQLIPEAGDLIKAVQNSEGDARAFALGRLSGCMEAYGAPAPATEEVETTTEVTEDAEPTAEKAEDYSKKLDDRLEQFAKRLDDIEQAQAQYSAPAGLKGKMGAEKEVADTRQTVTYFGTGRTALF